MKLTQLTTEQKLTYVGLLTEVQKDELVGQWYAPDSYFNPIQDLNDNWVISVAVSYTHLTLPTKRIV